jgi:hypothetical protein
MLKAVSEATDARARDWQRFLLVSVAAGRKRWDRARGVAAEIEDEETQRNARRVIAISQVMDVLRAFEDEDVDTSERAADFVRAADVPPEARAGGLAQAAELAARRGKRARAGELLGEATGYAEQTERAGDPRVTALALVTFSAARANEARVWELLPALVNAANEADNGLPYAVLGFDFKFEHLSQSVAFSTPQPPLDLREVFATTARLDLARTLTEARSLSDEVARANMLFAAARAALEKMGKARARAAS